MALKAFPKEIGKCWTFMISSSFNWDLANQTHSWCRYNISRISVAKNRWMNFTADVSMDYSFWTNGQLNSDHWRNNDFIKSVAFWYIQVNLVTSLLQTVFFSSITAKSIWIFWKLNLSIVQKQGNFVFKEYDVSLRNSLQGLCPSEVGSLLRSLWDCKCVFKLRVPNWVFLCREIQGIWEGSHTLWNCLCNFNCICLLLFS